MKRSNAQLPPIQQVIEEVLRAMGFRDFRISIEASIVPGHVSYNITGPDAALLIGREGKNLQALSKIVREIIAAKSTTIDSHFELENYVIDIDGYQRAEVQQLLSRVEETIKSLSADQTEAELWPMSPFHRRLIHSYVQNKPNIKSFSRGFGPNRVLNLKIIN